MAHDQLLGWRPWIKTAGNCSLQRAEECDGSESHQSLLSGSRQLFPASGQFRNHALPPRGR
jgi:hypothetical protein